MTVAWQPPAGHGIGCGQRGPAIEGYLLELDDGCGGEFRVSRRLFPLVRPLAFVHIAHRGSRSSLLPLLYRPRDFPVSAKVSTSLERQTTLAPRRDRTGPNFDLSLEISPALVPFRLLLHWPPSVVSFSRGRYSANEISIYQQYPNSSVLVRLKPHLCPEPKRMEETYRTYDFYTRKKSLSNVNKFGY